MTLFSIRYEKAFTYGALRAPNVTVAACPALVAELPRFVDDTRGLAEL
jgi:hypothetical protein